MLNQSPLVRRSASYGYQVPYAAQIRAEADILTMAVGVIVMPIRRNKFCRRARRISSRWARDVA